MNNNLLITMSGGTTTVINSTLVGIIKSAQQSNFIDKVYAGVPGLMGFLNDKVIDITNLDENELKLLKYTPSSCFIGTTRIMPLENNDYRVFENQIVKYSLKYFLNIGGNGTLKQTKSISNYFNNELKCIALPKTVDNDLGDNDFKMMYFTPGFPSAANYWKYITKIMNLENLGAYSHDKVLIAQTFGRETGFLAGCARLADTNREFPLLILLPEDQQPLNVLLNAIYKKIKENGRAIIVMSEGYKIGSLGARYDYSGQIMYGSSETTNAQNLVNYLNKNGIQSRSLIPTIDQRSNILYSTNEDLYHASRVGSFVVEEIEKGQHNFLASITRNKEQTIEYQKIDFESIKNFSRYMPEKWIKKGEFDVDDKYVEYLKSIPNTSIVDQIEDIFNFEFIKCDKCINL